jgi:hypothetical protein
MSVRKTLHVVKTPTGTQLRIGNKVVKDLGVVEFETARSAAYNYVWDRPQYMWTILGKNNDLVKRP